MKRDQTIHKATVLNHKNDGMEFKISRDEACKSCTIKNSCNQHGDSEQTIFVCTEQRLPVDTAVELLLPKGSKTLAIMLAYVIPLIFIFITLITVSRFYNELVAGLSAIGIIFPYGVLLYIFKEKISRRINIKILSIIFLALINFELVASTNFPVTGSMRSRVDFWKKVYTKIDTTEAFIHDSNDLTVIYKKVSLEKSRKARRRTQKREKQQIRNLLRSIAKKNYKNLTSKEQAIADIIGTRPRGELYKMARNVRFQYGLSDRYYIGLKRSYSYIDYIRKTLRKRNIPYELSYLPHVESSFNYQAYSKVGAAGIWQFMRGTARNYGLKVGYIIDERRDPLKATEAAARLLRDNYRTLKSWPLALTAYNHGPRSIKRAVKRVGSTDINTIIEKYDGRRFGFASKNFYATFMATVEISENPEQYFPAFKKPKEFIYSKIKLKKRYSIKQLIKNLKLSKQSIKKFNPAIRKIAYRSSLYLPRGFTLNVPFTTKEVIATYQNSLSKIKQPVDLMGLEKMHIISSGENLFDISKIYRVKMDDLIAFNQIVNPSRIYAGMKLKIPGKSSKIVVVEKKSKKSKKIVIKKTKIKELPTPTLISSKSINLESYNLDIKLIKDNIYQVTVEPEETLGHYADWATIKTQRLRNLNGLSFRSPIHLNNKIKIIIPKSRLNHFKEIRNEFHLSVQEDFYQTFKINGHEDYIVKRGDNLNQILAKFSLPFWLVRKEQPSGKLSDKLAVNQRILIPLIEQVKLEEKLEPNFSPLSLNTTYGLAPNCRIRAYEIRI